ncbi:MAG: CBS domain-containing protein [Candidatus Omnitrophica bacterium]|nr:CBS domain-containing protein [Candidatus Omnitrophota bacterium]
MKVKEIMTKEIKSLPPEMRAKEALDILINMKISGLPVLDKEGRLVGMFTEKDILRAILPGYLEKVGKFVYVENPKSIKIKIAGLDKLKVEDIMRKEVVTVSEDTTLCEAARLVLTQAIRRIPVLNKEHKVAGIIAREDIIKGLLTP